MKKRLLTALVLVLVASALVLAFAGCDETPEGVFSEGVVAAMNENGMWGYVNESGEEVIAFEFSSASPFKNGVALVKRMTGSFLIDSGGAEIGGPYASAQRVADGDFYILEDRENSLQGVYDSNSKSMMCDFVYSRISFDEETGVFSFTDETRKGDFRQYALADGTVTIARMNEEDIAGAAGKWLFVKSTDQAGEIVYKALDTTSGAENENVFEEFSDMGGFFMGGVFVLADNTYGEGGEIVSRKLWYATQARLFGPFDEEVSPLSMSNDGSMLLMRRESADGDGQIKPIYELYGKDGAVIYTGEEMPAAKGGFYYTEAYASGKLTFEIYAGGAKTTLEVSDLPAGTTSAQASGIEYFAEENAVCLTIDCLVTTGAGEQTQVKSESVERLIVAGNTCEIPSGYELVDVQSGKLVLRGETGRVGVFNADGTAVTACLYSDVQVADGGYIVVRAGNACGLLAPDGSSVLDFVYGGINV